MSSKHVGPSWGLFVAEVASSVLFNQKAGDLPWEMNVVVLSDGKLHEEKELQVSKILSFLLKRKRLSRKIFGSTFAFGSTWQRRVLE